MSISKDDLLKRKEQIMKDYDALTKEVEASELKIKQMKNNLNALAGAAQLGAQGLAGDGRPGRHNC